MKPFFSIIIPTLNEEVCLPKLLTGLERQKDKDFEVVIVDSNSKDKTKEVALSFNKLPLRFFNTGKHNVSHQRNYGAKKAKGKFLIFLDADSNISPNFTKNIKTVILRKKGLVFIPYVIPNSRDSQAKIIFRFVNFLVETSHSIGRPFSTGGTMIWEKNLFHLVGGFDERLYLAEDHNIVQKAYQWGVRAKFSPSIKYKFSLRRFKKEGELAVLYKYLLATAHFLIKGDIKKKIFEYQMGGEAYREMEAKKHLPLNKLLEERLKKVKNFFQTYLKEI